jgi:hypothetical protein
MSEFIAEFSFFFEYGAFSVRDSSVDEDITWEDPHSRQGFCRAESTVAFGALDEWGNAHVKVFRLGFGNSSHLDRLIAVPFFSPSGIVIVEGFDAPTPLFSVGQGHFRLWVGQYVIEQEEIGIEIHFEHLETPALKSEIIIKDDDLHPDAELLETCFRRTGF